MDPTCLIVIGETEDGQTFRPSDWAERLIDGAAISTPGRTDASARPSF